MADAPTRRLIASVTAISLTAALIMSVFSHTHAAIAETGLSSAAAPCPEHMPVPLEAVSDDGCESLCDSADLDHFLGLTADRLETDTPAAIPVEYAAPELLNISDKTIPLYSHGRDPPGSNLYLTTRRLRL